MFDLDSPVHHLELTTQNSICISCANGEKNQLLELALPMKRKSLANGSPGTVVSHDTDLKIKCGTFTNSRVAHMKTSKTDIMMAVSYENTPDVKLYQLSPTNTDEIKEESVFKCELEGACLDLNSTQVVLSKDNMSSMFLFDLKTGRMVEEIYLKNKDSAQSFESVNCIFVDPNLISLCHKASGKIHLYDTRASMFVSSLNGSVGRNCDFWSFSSTYKSSESNEKTLIGMVSNQGMMKIYDCRNLEIPSFSANLGIKTLNDSVQLKLKPTNNCLISVSGFNGDVYVYELLTDPELVFVHDGHSHVEGLSSETITTSHLWYPDMDNLIISSASNGSIQSWQFEDKRKCNRTEIH